MIFVGIVTLASTSWAGRDHDHRKGAHVPATLVPILLNLKINEPLSILNDRSSIDSNRWHSSYLSHFLDNFLCDITYSNIR